LKTINFKYDRLAQKEQGEDMTTTTYAPKSEKKTYQSLDVKRSYKLALEGKCRTSVTFTVPEEGIPAGAVESITALLKNYEFTQQMFDNPVFARITHEYRKLFEHEGMPVRVNRKNHKLDGKSTRYSFFATVDKNYYQDLAPGTTIEFQFPRAGRLEIEVAKQLRGILRQL
jgi:predicted metal-dependent peptidase